ncbi:unnamed protein product, partial [Brassica napus]
MQVTTFCMITSYLLSQAKSYIKWYWLTIRSNLMAPGLYVSCNISLSNSKILIMFGCYSRRYTSSQCILEPSGDLLRFQVNNLTVNTGNGTDFTRKEVELMLQAGDITVGLGPHR